MGTPDLKELRQRLYLEIGDRVREYGFKNRSAHRSYVKSFDGGKGSLHLMYGNYGDHFTVAAEVNVRIDAVEDILNVDSLRLTEKEKRDTYTIGVNLGNFIGTGYVLGTVATESDVEIVTGKIMDLVPTIVIPYVEENRVPENAYRLLAPFDQRESWQHAPMKAQQARTLLALSVLLGRPDTETLIGQLREHLKNDHPLHIEQYETLVTRIGRQKVG